VLVQPGYTFSYSPTEGYKGLVTGKSAVLIYARGGAYGSGTGGEKLDMQKSYMETVLGFIGFSNIKSIVIEPTLKSTPEELEKIKDAAKEQAKTISRNF
jgi:FMN-dependent NADH-azoreductase